jgi:hypothetical protein
MCLPHSEHIETAGISIDLAQTGTGPVGPSLAAAPVSGAVKYPKVYAQCLVPVTGKCTNLSQGDCRCFPGGSTMDNFIATENVRHLRRELENGAEPAKRDTMLRILVEEENKLGFTRELLGRLDHHISRLSEIMARQVELIDNLTSLGEPLERSQMILATLNDLMAAYIAHRHRINGAL